jgi:hypothetical protein
MAKSRLLPPHRIRPRDQPPRPTVTNNKNNAIGKTPLPINTPRTLPNPHLRNRLHPPSPPNSHAPHQTHHGSGPLLVPPSLPALPPHHLRPKQHLARRNRQRRLPLDRLLHPPAMHVRSAP